METEGLKLHENKDELRAAIASAAKNLSLPEHVIEKDYWVTKLLYNLSRYEFKEYIVFKGGTSLSKGHRLIKRFSEDVDLALRPEGIGQGKIHRRMGDALHRVVKAIKDPLFNDDEEGKESEAKRYKRVYTFPQNFIFPVDSPIHGKIVVEVNSFTNPVPVESVQIASLVSEYLLSSQGEAVVKELELVPFPTLALAPERTFCEKLLALRRAYHKGGEFFEQRIRHVYDIHQLFRSTRIQHWIESKDDFVSLLQKCHDDDELNQKITRSVSSDFKSFSIFANPASELERYSGAYEQLKNIAFDHTIPSLSKASASLSEINNILIDFRFSEANPAEI